MLKEIYYILLNSNNDGTWNETLAVWIFAMYIQNPCYTEDKNWKIMISMRKHIQRFILLVRGPSRKLFILVMFHNHTQEPQ